MHIGFVGSIKGMRKYQKEELFAYLNDHKNTYSEFHHGDCIGGDAEACACALALGFRVTAHPPKDESIRAWTQSHDRFEPAIDSVRNAQIVDMCHILIVAPNTDEDQLTANTWAAAKYAHRAGVTVKCLRP